MLDALLKETRLPLRLRKKIGKFFPVRDNIRFETRLFENAYAGITGNHLDNKTYLYGMHEPATIRFMRAVLSAQRAGGISPVYWDVGTNTGAHLLGVASLADRAFGFEPWAPVRALATENIARNDLSHVQIFDCGLGAEDALQPFASPVAGNHGTGSFYRRDDAAQSMLKVCRGDSVVKDTGIAPTLIKIDTEGYEGAVLDGLHDTLRGAAPVVVFEYSAMTKADMNGPHSLTALFGDGYDFYCLKPSREYPRLEKFKPDRRCENCIAWPKNSPVKLDDVLRR